MEDSDSDTGPARLHQDQPFDESLDVPDSEEVASIYTPSPRVPPGGKADFSGRGETPPDSRMSSNDDEDDQDVMAGGHPGGGFSSAKTLFSAQHPVHSIVSWSTISTLSREDKLLPVLSNTNVNSILGPVVQHSQCHVTLSHSV